MNFESHAPNDTEALARIISLWVRPGFAILLNGELGSGKSTFARALIKALGPGQEFDIPSPTFSLVQTYDLTRMPVAHVDLYRLARLADFDELGLSEIVSNHVLLIEWPNEQTRQITENYLTLTFTGAGQRRDIAIRAFGAWQQALQRNAEIESFLQSSGLEKASREFLDGDASSRRYEKVYGCGEAQILMDMPQRPDGPPVKDGKPYSAVAHLAEGMVSVEAVNDQLCAMGYSAPKMSHCDVSRGLALIEDLGRNVFGRMMIDGEDMNEPMLAAVEVLADMAQRDWPTSARNRDGVPYSLKFYDEGAQLIEVDLLPSWFHVHVHGKQPGPELGLSFAEEWKRILPHAIAEKPVWVLRDYHSPNLIWLPERKGIARVGLIDTQDAVLGHPAYDLASMLQDARVDVAPDHADRLYAHYVKLRKAHGGFDEVEFARAYAILGAQRATKILGIFARLNARDGKPGYLKHMPRVSRYLARYLEHPALTALKRWYEAHMPEALNAK